MTSPSTHSIVKLEREVADLRAELHGRRKDTQARNAQLDRESEIDSLRASVDDASKLVRNLTFLFLLIGLYIALIGGRTDHEILLRAGDIDLPFLALGVNVVWFYGLAPVAWLVLHFNLLLQCLQLTRKIQLFAARLNTLDADEAMTQRGLLFPFPLAQVVMGQGLYGWAHVAFVIMVWVMYVLIPLAVLLWAMKSFLPYQHDWITPLHGLIIALDVVLLWCLWPAILGVAIGRWRIVKAEGDEQPIDWRTWSGLGLKAAVSVAVLASAYGLAREPQSFWMERQSWVERSWAKLTVTDRILMEREPPAELIEQMREEALAAGKNPDEAETAAFLNENVAEPLNLTNRNLRHADLSRSALYDVNIEGADLGNAILASAKLPDALGNQDTILVGANLRDADLAGAFLQHAELAGARLSRADLAGAALNFADLAGADLQDAHLAGAVLIRSAVDGACLIRADMTGACLGHAALRGGGGG
ncbi:MAG: pentapeptide repeat-containing protein, partial [Geminicoccaceae bacterium]